MNNTGKNNKNKQTNKQTQEYVMKLLDYYSHLARVIKSFRISSMSEGMRGII